jgi:hypothetical protein
MSGRGQVRHFGNTANNAFHNVVLLREHAGIESELPIRMFGLAHPISAPAWDAIEFEVPSVEWVAQPDWSMIPDAVSINTEYTDIAPPPPPESGSPVPAPGPLAAARSVAGRAFEAQYGKRWAQPLFDISYRRVLSRRPVIREHAQRVDVLYGSDSMMWAQVEPTSSRYVCFEHGTIRWIADGAQETAVVRRAYRDQVARAQQLWVTNLDPRTLEIAEDVAPGRWSALPHPFVPDARVPFAGSRAKREQLLAATGSEYLILLPSSQNWAKTHDKGSKKALTAFVELRRAGIPVGLAAVEWGLQLAESKALLDEAGVGGHVTWIPPMARFSLQRMMADVDVVWDQFGLDAFGALALRAVEQGTPLVSRGLVPAAERLIGGPVPWLQAATTEEIVRETTGLVEEIGRDGRSAVIEGTRSRYRDWFLDRHSAALTARLQGDVYAKMLDGTFEPGDAAPDQWARLLGEGPRED